MAGTQVRASTDRLPIRIGENHKLAWASAAVGQRTGGRGYFLLTFFAEPLVFWTAVEESATGAAGSIIFSESRRLSNLCVLPSTSSGRTGHVLKARKSFRSC